MSIEIEHAAGTSMEDIKKAEKEFSKDSLALSMGISRDGLNDKINEVKGFFNGRKEFMRDNRRTEGNTTFYPTSKACLRGFKKKTCTHIHKDAPESSTCVDCENS